MTKNSIIITLGVIVAVVPFSGFPIATKEIIFISLGLLIVIISYFTSVQYCASCKRIIKNGHYGQGEEMSSHTGQESSHSMPRDISGISPPEMK